MDQKLLQHGAKILLRSVSYIVYDKFLVSFEALYMYIARLTLLCIIIGLVPAVGQKKVTLKQAGTLTGGVKNGERFERVIRDAEKEVIFVQNNTTIYCDSAHFYRSKNSIEAFGHVRITESDSITITASRLEYDGNKKQAKLRNNVIFTKLATATLYTDFLDYDRPSNQAYYFNGPPRCSSH